MYYFFINRLRHIISPTTHNQNIHHTLFKPKIMMVIKCIIQILHDFGIVDDEHIYS